MNGAGTAVAEVLSLGAGVTIGPTQIDRPYLMSVRKTAEYIGRTEKAVRHMYERRILTPLRIDGRVFIDRREIDAKYDKARVEAY